MRIIITLLLTLMVFAQGSDFENAKSSFDNEKYDIALTDIENAISSDTTQAEYFRLGAEIALKLDDLDKTGLFIKKAIEIDLKNEEYRSFRESIVDLKSMMTDAKRSYDSGLYEEAIGTYEKINEKYPTFASAFYLKGMVYYTQDDFGDAVENFQNATILNPFAEKYQKAILNISGNLYNEGNKERRRKSYDLAIEKYLKALEYNPQFSDALFWLAYSYYKVDDYENAKKYLKRNADVDPTHYKSTKLLGDVFTKLGETESAIEWFRKTVDINPNYDKAWYALGRSLLSVNNQDGAIAALNMAIDVTPDYSKAYEILGVIYQSQEKTDLAIKNYLLASKYDDKAYVVFYRLAAAYNDKKDYENAKSSAKNCMNIKPNYAGAFFELGIAELNLCNEASSKSSFEKAKSAREYKNAAEDYLKNFDKYAKHCK